MSIHTDKNFFCSTRKPVDLSIEERCARDVLTTCGPTVRRIVAATAAYFDIEPWQVVYRRRPQLTYRWRAVAMAVARSRTSMSLPEIGRRFGGFHHTTALHAVRRADRNAVAAICLLLNEVRA